MSLRFLWLYPRSTIGQAPGPRASQELPSRNHLARFDSMDSLTPLNVDV